MKLDSEKQRQTLLQCIEHTVLSGEFMLLMPLMSEIAELHTAVGRAEIEGEKNAGIPGT